MHQTFSKLVAFGVLTLCFAFLNACAPRQTLPTMNQTSRTVEVRIQAPIWHTVNAHRALESMLRRDLKRTGLASQASHNNNEADWFLEGEILEGTRTVNAFTWTLRDAKRGTILAQETYHDFYGVTAPRLADRIMTRLLALQQPQETPAPTPTPPTPNPQSPTP